MSAAAASPPPPPPIALSLKARGLALPPLDAHGLAAGGRRAVCDITWAVAAQLALLTWSTWLSVVLTVLWVVFFANYYRGAVAAADGSVLVPLALLVYLPTLAVAWRNTSRRAEVATHLGAVQSHVLGAYVLHSGLTGCGAPQLLAELDDGLSDAMMELQSYLTQPRALGTVHFSASLLHGQALSTGSDVYRLGSDMGQRLRRLQACLRRLSATAGSLLEHCSCNPAAQPYAQQALALAQLLVPLTGHVAALTAAKDLHSPLLLRAMLRPGVVLLSPLLSSLYWAGEGLIGRPVTPAGEVSAIVVGSIVQVLLMSLYELGQKLEDPFDTGPAAPPDTLSLLEFNTSLAYLTGPPCDVAASDDADAALEGGHADVTLDLPASAPGKAGGGADQSVT